MEPKMIIMGKSPGDSRDRSVGGHYQALIRLAESLRNQPEMQAFIRVLAHELSAVTHLDAVAYFNESLEKVEWHFCGDPEPMSSPTAGN